jgi:hypothetical protein
MPNEALGDQSRLAGALFDLSPGAVVSRLTSFVEVCDADIRNRDDPSYGR